MDEAVAALKEKHEREKILLTEENRKLTAETDKVSDLDALAVDLRTSGGGPADAQPSDDLVSFSSAPLWTS